MLAVSWLNSQIIFDGIVQGLAIAVIAVGVVLVYRATRIINFAVGGMGVVGAVMLALFTLQYHVPFWIAFFLSILIGVIFGAIVDATIIRRLRRAPKVVVLVATIGVAQLAQVIAVEIPTPSDVTARYPAAFNGSWTIAGVSVHGTDLSVLVLAPIAILGLAWFLDRTTLGKTVKACSSNTELARISSINPRWVSIMVWSLAAGLSTLSIILLAGQSGSVGEVANLGPETLSRDWPPRSSRAWCRSGAPWWPVWSSGSRRTCSPTTSSPFPACPICCCSESCSWRSPSTGGR